MEVNRLAYLFRRYFEKTSTPAEKTELLRLIGEHSHDASLKDLLDEALLSYSTDQQLDDHTANNLFQSIVQEAASRPPIKAVVVHHSSKRIWYRAVAAIAAGLILVATTWLLLTRNEQPGKTQAGAEVPPPVEVMPGGNRAVLTLSDGSQLQLDNTGNGNIAQQANVTILKKKDGELSYQLSAAIAGPAVANNTFNTLTTPRGGQYKLTLPDGSKVWLNAASSIRYPVIFAGKERSVEITGEAYFEVAKNAKIPFRVQANRMEVEVLGTHFNVNSYSTERFISTTLVEGSVRVKAGRGAPLVLKPGMQASLATAATAPDLLIEHAADIDAVIAWKNGLFHFEGATIYEVMAQLERWYDLEVEYKGNISKHFRGMIARNANITEVFSMLELTGEIQFKIEGKKVTVMP